MWWFLWGPLREGNSEWSGRMLPTFDASIIKWRLFARESIAAVGSVPRLVRAYLTTVDIAVYRFDEQAVLLQVFLDAPI